MDPVFQDQAVTPPWIRQEKNPAGGYVDRLVPCFLSFLANKLSTEKEPLWLILAI